MLQTDEGRGQSRGLRTVKGISAPQAFSVSASLFRLSRISPPGAPVFAANAAVRTGSGLVYLGVPGDIYPIAAAKCDEAMPFPLPKKYDMILV